MPGTASKVQVGLDPSGGSAAVVAVPDMCTAGGPARHDGAAARERLRARATAAGTAAPRLVETSTAVTACWAADRLPGTGDRFHDILVVDVGHRAVTAAQCTVGLRGATPAVRLRRSVTARCPRPFAEALTAPRTGNPTRAALGAVLDELDDMLGEAVDDGLVRALAAGQRRAELLLPRARDMTRYRAATAYRVGGNVLDAGTVVDAFAPVRDTIRAAVTALNLPVASAPVQPDHHRPDTALRKVVLAGGLSRLPLTLPAVLALTRAWAGDDGPAVLDEAAAARGAAAIAAGTVAAPAPDPPQVALARTVDGRPRVARFPLGCAPVVELDTGDDGVVRCTPAGSTSVDGTNTNSTSGGRPTGNAPLEARLVARPAPGQIRPGRWLLDWWPDRSGPGTVVFRRVAEEADGLRNPGELGELVALEEETP